jgi:copper transport protein
LPARRSRGAGRPRRRRRPASVLLLAALLAGAGLIWLAPAAGAHALLESSDPAGGSTVARAPDSVTLTFTEDPEPGLTEVEVLDPSGTVVSSGPASVLEDRPATVRVPLGDVSEGVYTVTWRVVSRVDGHTTAGAFAFGVGVAPTGRPQVEVPETPPASPLEMAGRWLFLGGLGILIGTAWVGVLAFPGPPRHVVVAARMAWAASVLGLLCLGAGQMLSTGAGPVLFLGSSVGRAVLFRGAFLLVAGGAVLSRRARVGLVVAGTAAALALLVHVVSGHANAYGAFRPAKVAAQWVHIVAAGVWLGGLLALLLGVRGEPSDLKARAVRRFSSVAVVALFVVFATGVVRSLTEVPSWGALVSTLYGALVLVKLGLLAGLLGLGAVNRYRNVRRADRSLSGLRRISRTELILAAAALAAAAVMASVAPRPQEETVAAEPQGIVASGTDFARTVQVNLRANPGSAGVNEFTVRVTRPASGEAVEAERVALEFIYFGEADVGRSVLELERAGPGTFRAEGANLSIAGLWRIDVVVQEADDSVEIPLQLGTRCGATPIPGDPTLWNVQTPEGTAQGYVDPGVPGQNEVHITFFGRDGTEMDVGRVAMTASPEGGDSMMLDPRRLGPGHFVAGVELGEGIWRFDASGSAGEGAALSACFEQRIGE